MEAHIARQLIELNREFYSRFAADFAISRRRLQPGIERAFALLQPRGVLLDLGCGSGRIAPALPDLPGRVTRYVGLDSSRDLLAWQGEPPGGATFIEADLADPDWPRLVTGPFETILALSVLHHIPGTTFRLQFLQQAADLLTPAGNLVISLWQVLQVPRLAAKIRPWQKAGIDPDQVEERDLLMTWGQGDAGQRYVHHFTREEATDLCHQAGLQVTHTYRSDGATGDMGLYLLCRN